MGDNISEAVRGHGVSITIKYGKGYEETWANFAGTIAEVREDLIEAFGLDRASVAGLTLSGIILNATQVAHAKGNLGSQLGAVSIPADSSPAATSESPFKDDAVGSQPPSDDPWAGGTDESATDPIAELRAQVEAQTSVDALRLLWSDNQAAFASDASLMAAYKVKGKALSKSAAA